jgi:hypothetical protein
MKIVLDHLRVRGQSEPAQDRTRQAPPEAAAKDLKRAVKSASAELSSLNSLVKKAIGDVVSKTGCEDLNREEIQQSVEKAVKEAVRERVQEIMDESAET